MGAQPKPFAELRALDPDLPVLAARAAMQLDAAITAARKHGPIDKLRTDAISQLAEMISNVSTAIQYSGDLPSKALTDPLTATLVSRAYADVSRADVKSLNDLREAAQKLSKMFENASSAKPQHGQDPLEALSMLRDFCIKLSEYAASKRQLAYGNRPTHSYWRLF